MDRPDTEHEETLADRLALEKGLVVLSAEELYPNMDENKIKRKMDLRIIPVVAVLYLMAFLDRGNIGNAKIEGLTDDLNLHGNQYNIALTVFFITYSSLEVPANMILQRLRPSIWLPSIMVCWGVVMTLMGIVQNFQGLVAARLFLGVAEAGLYPGVAFYLTTWYCRGEMQFRQAMFFSSASTAGAFSGLLAWAIAKMDGVAGLRGWRWIFILEGIATVLIACVSFFLSHDSPATASFLTEEEREYVQYRIRYDGNSGRAHIVGGGSQDALGHVEEASDLSWQYFKDAFTDWQLYLHLLLYFGIVCPLYGVSLFLPSILSQMGYVTSKAQLMTVPIYITAAILSVVQAWISDRVGMRSPFIALNLVCMLTGYVMAIANDPTVRPGVSYAGVYLVGLGIYPAFPGIVSWLSNNLAGSYKRAIGMAFQIGVGNFGGAFASNFYREVDAPRYKLGHGLELMFIGIGFLGLIPLVILYSATNRKREKDLLEGKYHDYTPQQLSAMGDKNPHFRYRL